MEFLKSLFGGGGGGASSAGSAIPDWVEALPRGVEALAIARLLLEMAHADGDFDDAERKQLSDDLAHEFQLDADQASKLFDLAEAKFSDQVEFSSLILQLKAKCSVEERAEILRLLWKVAYADGKLNDFEFALVRRMAAMLYVEGPALGVARRKALEELGFDPETPAGADPVALS